MNSKTFTLAAGIILLAGGSLRAQTDDAHAARDKKFAETLSGVTLVGFHTDSTKPAGKLTEERYSISSVSKLKDDYWLFKVRIKYGTHDVTLPLSLQVKWAGDTPVITLTDLDIPLLGKFSARVVIYDGSYAGTWSGAKHGGHLFGKIEKDKKPAIEDESRNEKAEVRNSPTLLIKLDEKGKILVDGVIKSPEQLKGLLKEFVAETGDKGRIVLDPHRDCPYKHAVELLNICSSVTHRIAFSPADHHLTIKIALDADGTIRVNAKPVSIADLRQVIDRIVSESRKEVWTDIDRHPECSYEQYRRVIAIIANVKDTKVGAESSSEKRR